MIRSSFQYVGQTYEVEYQDLDNFNALEREKCSQVYGLCFFGNKVVLVHNGQKHHWSLPGGSIEQGEVFEQTLTREILEETNMEIIVAKPLGYQKVTAPDGNYVFQLRYVCLVVPKGEFEKDPGGQVDRIDLVEPHEFNKILNWGEIGKHLLMRGLEAKPLLESQLNIDL